MNDLNVGGTTTSLPLQKLELVISRSVHESAEIHISVFEQLCSEMLDAARSTTSTTIIMLCILVSIAFLLWRASRKVMAQQLALGELLTKVHSLRRECNGLSDENAWTQREFYDLQHGKPMQLPKELCVTEHGRYCDQRACGKIRNQFSEHSIHVLQVCCMQWYMRAWRALLVWGPGAPVILHMRA